jgi:hypothetical protein
LHANLSEDHPIRSRKQEKPGRGIEIVFEVDDIESVYNHVLAQDWHVASGLQPQPWSLTDFRILDPDGYYLRITTRKGSDRN